jgi:outer membrane lipoprotein-sorting protein
MKKTSFTILFLFCLRLVSWSEQSRVDTLFSPSNNATPLIDSIIATQKKTTSISCKYHQKRWLNNVGPTEYQGDISYQAPEKILMHFLYPADEYVLVTDSTVLIYGIKNEYGVRYLKKCLSPAEQQIAEQIGQIKMNIVQTMRGTYNFALSDSADPENTAIAATPKGGWKSLGKITILVDTRKKIVKSIVIYAKDGLLLSSTAYSDFIPAVASGAWFPRVLTVTLNAGLTLQKDQITYSRIEFNKPFSKNHFSVPVAKNAKIVDNIKDCK